MDINARNFTQEWPAIEAAIAKCDFMAIDTEMTGLGRGTDRPIPFESPSARYLRIKNSSEGFLIVQFGLACFRFDEAASCYDVTTFNFYVFPQQLFSVDRRFHCQSGSLRFLASHNFDFNQTIYHGIPFLDRSEETKVQGEMEQHSAAKVATPQRSDIVLKDEDKTWIVERVAQLSAWQPTAVSGTALKFDRCSPYHRRLLYQELPKEFPDVKLETVRAEECVAASFPTAEQAVAREVEKKKQRDAEFLTGLGFTRVVRAMQATKRPIIGHNMLLDSLHLFEQFELPLPPTLEEFKRLFNAVWPVVYDTKHIASLSSVLNKIVTATNLEDAATRTTKEPFTEVVLRQAHAKYSGEGAKLHEAGYDAFLTGCLFLRMAHHVCNSASPPDQVRNTRPLAALLPHLAAFRNRIPMARSDTCFFLEGPEEAPDRSAVIHVSGITKSDLSPVLSKFCPIRFLWINDQSFFALLEDATQVQPLLKHLHGGGLDPATFPGVQVVDWTTYEASNNGNLVDPATSGPITPKGSAAKTPKRRGTEEVHRVSPKKAARKEENRDTEMKERKEEGEVDEQQRAKKRRGRKSAETK